MKNRIMRKIAAAGMAVFLVGMLAGSGYMWKEVPVYAAEAVFETDEGQKDGYQVDAGERIEENTGAEKAVVRKSVKIVSETSGMNAMENVTEGIVGASETVGVESKDIDVLTDEIQNSVWISLWMRLNCRMRQNFWTKQNSRIMHCRGLEAKIQRKFRTIYLRKMKMRIHFLIAVVIQIQIYRQI